MDSKNAIQEEMTNRFQSYDEFLDSQVTSEDVHYLEDLRIARKLVELGYRGSGGIMSREVFDSIRGELTKIKDSATKSESEKEIKV